MRSRIAKASPKYGMARGLGKALATFLFLTSPAWAEEVTILAFGDSLTQGFGLPPEDGFVPQLGRWLDAASEDAVLINGGVSGDTTAGGLRRVGWSLTEDVDAMILTLGGNDLLRGTDPAVTKANLDGILQVAGEKGVQVLLVGMRANANYGPDHKSAFDALYPELSEAYDVQFYPNFFKGLGVGEPKSFLPFFQRDGIHPNAKGVALIVADLGPAVQALIAAAKSPAQ